MVIEAMLVETLSVISVCYGGCLVTLALYYVGLFIELDRRTDVIIRVTRTTFVPLVLSAIIIYLGVPASQGPHGSE